MRSVPFLSQPDKVLWLSLCAEKFAVRPSQLVELDDANAALDFDLACTFRLELYEAEIRKAAAMETAFQVGKMLFGSKDSGGQTLDGNSLMQGDPYSDENTQVW